jgi:UTP--glucose-1-phosphate uridylyltransferase
LGLGHAVLCARNVVGKEPFAVLLGDDLFDSTVPGLFQMRRIFEAYGRPVIGLWKVMKDECQRYGIIDGMRIGRNLFKIKSDLGHFVIMPPFHGRD